MERINILPTPNSVHRPLEWATLEIRCIRWFLLFGPLFSIWPQFLNLANPNFWRPVRAFCFERPCVLHHCREANPLFSARRVLRTLFDFSVRLHSLLLERHHCVTSAHILPICHCVVENRIKLLNLDWARHGVVLYSLPLNLCLCFCFDLNPTWVLHEYWAYL